MVEDSKASQLLELDIEGMTCTACARRIEKNLNKLNGVRAYVDFASEKAHIEAKLGVSRADLVSSIEESGYTVGADHSELSRLKLRIIVGLVLSIPVVAMTMSAAFMVNMWLIAGLSLPVATYVAWPFHSAAAKNLRHLTTTMDTLVSLGVLVAYGYGVYCLLTNRHDTYFEVAAVVPTIVLFGRWLEVRTRRSATDSVKALLSAIPDTAIVRRDGVQMSVATNQLNVGDSVVVAAGDRLPVDGLIIEGAGLVDNSLVTGESVPEYALPGSQISAGSLNLSGSFVYRATAVSGNSRISQIADLVREASAKKAKITSVTDRVSSYFVPSVIVLATLTYLTWALVLQDSQRGFSAAIAVLVIACPCALGIAVPISLAVATSLSVRRGIVIRDPDSLSLLSMVNTVVFDKTGTLTDGQLQVQHAIAMSDMPREKGIRIASALERNSTHPIAKAIASLDGTWIATNVVETPGFGLTGSVEGEEYSIGWNSSTNFRNQKELDEAVAFVGAASLAVLWRGSEALLLIALSDRLRHESPDAIRQLKQLHVESVLLSGDVASRVSQVAQELEIGKWFSRVSPEKKLQVLGDLKVAGSTTAMVGDGLNDVAALAGADVGIAMGSGTHAAQAAASVTVLDDNPLAVPFALNLGRRTWRNIKQNLIWAFGYNVVLIPVAAFGLLNPMLSGAAMAFSSVSVVLNALRLRRVRH